MISLLAMPPGDMSALLLVVSPGLSGVEVVAAFLLVVGPRLTGVEAADAILLVVGPGLTGDSVAKEVEVDVDAFLDFLGTSLGFVLSFAFLLL
jgi:hypothetical protein